MTQRNQEDTGPDAAPVRNKSGGNDAPKKVFNDSVHGHIELHPLLVSIIDTPEFQRLRFIKQLGMCYFVYPGAAHNRFEHSVGVSYLAGELARSLQSKQSHLGIDDKDVLCVEIAGLCHDLGHGPFSHLFDDLFIPRVEPENKKKHEALSVEMLKHLRKKNECVEEQFVNYGLGDTYMDFIEELITGVPTDSCRDKSFLYEIVANKRNGIDVDKWDYFARDSYYLGIGNSFDWRRLIKSALVLNAPNEVEKQICYRDKEIDNLYDMFHTRYMLHKRAYQHRVNMIIGEMMVEALVAANDHLTFPDENGTLLSMSNAIGDMEAYAKMTDHVMWAILASPDVNLKKSKDILQRILKRDLYPYIGETRLTSGGTLTEEGEMLLKEELHKSLDVEAKKVVKVADIIIRIASFSYSMGGKNPMQEVKFYSKQGTESEAKVIDVNEILARDPMSRPKEFSVDIMRVYIRNTQKEVEQVLGSIREAFKEWRKEQERGEEETSAQTAPQ